MAKEEAITLALQQIRQAQELVRSASKNVDFDERLSQWLETEADYDLAQIKFELETMLKELP